MVSPGPGSCASASTSASSAARSSSTASSRKTVRCITAVVVAKRDKKWQPVEERTLSLPVKGLEVGTKTWEVNVTGERALWDRRAMTVERATAKMVCKQAEPGFPYSAEHAPALKWLPTELHPEFIKGKLVAVGLGIEDRRAAWPGCRACLPGEQDAR